jgi:hypothetical protein
MPPLANPSSAKPVPLTYHLAQLAYGLHAALEGHLHDTLEELDLTLTLADALWQLDPALGPLSRRELAERLRCAHPTSPSWSTGSSGGAS